MAQNNMHNLTTLIKRLEAATSRLEDIASSAGSLDASQQQNQQQQTAAGDRAASTGTPSVAAVGAQHGASSSPAPPPVPPKEDLPKMIEEFDALIDGDLTAYHNASKAMGGLLSEQAAAVVDAFKSERSVLLLSTKSSKPDMSAPVYMEILKDLQKDMTAVDNLRHNNRASEYKDHLAMVADGVGALGWITYESKPADAVADLFGGAQIFGNKVLKQYKDKEEAHVDWVKTFYKVMRSLIAYIKEYHPRGVQWNPKGVEPIQALKDLQSGGVASPSSPPPPPGFSSNAPPPPPMPAGGIPTPPPPPPPGGAPAPKSRPADMGAVFADLNKGESVTSGLKKVDASMQTHKNPSLRAGAQVPARSDSTGSSRGKSPAPPGKKPKPETLRQKKPPRQELDGNKWFIENYESPSEQIVINAELNQSILISRCKATTIQIHGKANAITIDNSTKTNLILDSLVSSIDVIKCPNFALQILGYVPTVLLDQVDSASVYLSKDSLQTEIFTSKCTSVNINLPPQKEDDDYVEAPVPEQFRSYIKDGKLVTEIVEHAG